jgi:hypothetical protein
LLNENRCTPAIRTPGGGQAGRAANSSRRTSGLNPNWVGAPVIRMPAAPSPVPFTRSRQSTVASCARAAAATRRRSAGDSAENRRTPARTAAASSAGVFAGPV